MTLREPHFHELRGIMITDLLQIEVTAISMLLPRISVDGLTPHEVTKLAFCDLVKVGGIIIGFTMPLIKTEGAK